MQQILILVFLLTYSQLFSQEKKDLIAYRTTEHIKIDGKFNEITWKNAPKSANFMQFSPNPNDKPTAETSVQIAYDDVALYVTAKIKQNPDSVYQIFSARDEIDNTDFFGILLDPYNDGLKAYSFSVSAAGVQADIAFTSNKGDNNWNAVWYSAVRMTKTGWQVEMKIPYSELRFAKANVQTWGLNFFQSTQSNREMDAWNPLDVKIDNFIIQSGTLSGLKNLQPPLRLSFLPYSTAYLIKSQEGNKWGSSIKGGMDLKYGINESFTLDMMLIPDFGQVESDDQVLNLSPYETYYNEKRPFFMEGTELFGRARIFYSRRIGATPQKYDEVYDDLYANEKVTTHPSELQLINATKISGKTKSGYSVGFLNALSGNSYATIVDTAKNSERRYLMQGMTNFNVSVVEKSLKNNSYISLINTNVNRLKDHYIANVTGLQTDLYNNSKKYQLRVRGALSYKNKPEFNSQTGFYVNTALEKVKGNFRFELSQNTESNTYDPNDLGYLQQNNEFSQKAQISYQIFKPKYFYNNWNIKLKYEHQMLYKPFVYTKSFLFTNGHLTFKNNMSAGFFVGRSLTNEKDYFEPRTDGYVYIKPWDYFYHLWFSTNYAKDFAIDFGGGGTRNPIWNSTENSIFMAPRYRIGNKFSIRYQIEYNQSKNNRGYVENTEKEVIFGKRNLETITNSLNISYIINKDAAFNLRFRHYWTSVRYKEYYTLLTNGNLVHNDINASGQDINFNALTINANLRWQFLPGSELVLVWKNELLSDNNEIIIGYFENFKHSLSLPQTNSISLKIRYYIDYQNIKQLF